MVWDELNRVLNTYDSDFRCECGNEWGWSGQLRITLTDPDNAPSRSITFFKSGGSDPEEVTLRVLADFREWLEMPSSEPLPAPAWKR